MTIVAADLYFALNSHVLSARERRTLAQFTPALQDILHDFSDLIIVIEGHADDRGLLESNDRLALERAETVRRTLLSLSSQRIVFELRASRSALRSAPGKMKSAGGRTGVFISDNQSSGPGCKRLSELSISRGPEVTSSQDRISQPVNYALHTADMSSAVTCRLGTAVFRGTKTGLDADSQAE